MLIQTYFKPRDGLPNPKGPFLLSTPLQVIALASSEAAKATRDKSLQEMWPIQEMRIKID